jgi:hypothetical protein
VTGDACPLTFEPVSATAVNSSGPYQLVKVTCVDPSNGAQLIVTVAR